MAEDLYYQVPGEEPEGEGGASRFLCVYIGGANAETYDRADHPQADEDGHVISATVLSQRGSRSPVSPVQVRVAHGASVDTAATMLRKMADLLERAPDLLSGSPGDQARRERDGHAHRTRLTPEDIRAATEAMDAGMRRRFGAQIEEIMRALRDPEAGDGEPGV